ncbi:MAG: malonyl-CoA decarboxylase [Gammaproteobacteria bacterium]|nr:MAG: decarboxylase [Gammaproteobacteria bacterium]UCH41630.1 MAG: malonyl-CoA decarboxylase [Gammaproteobacteria bacterium]
MPSLRLSNWAPAVIRKHLLNEETETIDSLCAMMMASDGEYSSLLLAERILNAYEKLGEDERLAFFRLLHSEYDIDADAIKTAVADYERNPDASNLLRVTNAAEPGRQELLRRINLTPGGTRRLVKMREHLLTAMRDQPELKKIDTDFHHLFNAWFNRGFLLMEPIDWTTPAHILEKIIAYEAVHEIENWAELRSRLEPSDRYCYGFFHPSMEDEPLVFVEVALTDQVPSGIGQILQRDPAAEIPENPSCAIFYSISNCHRGLAGVSFGNFLIKQVATSLKLRFPQLKTFATISPVPGLRRWLEAQAEAEDSVAALIEEFDADADDELRAEMEKLAASYLLEQKNGNNEPLDPVARFHLKNGAILERINILGNPSDRGMKRSFGSMVNYVYDLSRVEENHEEYVKNNQVISSSQVKKALSR